MDKEKLKQIGIGSLILILGVVIGTAVGRYSLPDKVVVKTEVKEVVKKVVKTVEVDKSIENRNKEMVKKIIKNPDGTVITEIHWVDKTVIAKDETKNTTKEEERKTETKSSKETINQKVRGSARLLAGYNFGGSSWIPGTKGFVFGAQIEKQIIGPFSLGVFFLTDKSLGLSAGINF
jgi:hypothetical protein